MIRQANCTWLLVLATVISGCASRGDYANVPVEEAGSQSGAVYESSGYPPRTEPDQRYPAPDYSETDFPPPPTYDKPAQAPAAASTNSAVIALLSASQQQRQQGEYQQAAATLERAIRISPRNGQLYYELAQVRYLEGNYQQSKQLCRKAISLAAGDKPLLERSRLLLSELPD